MNRRQFLASAAGGALAMGFPAEAADTKPKIIELVRYQLRNTSDDMMRRTSEFLSKSMFPAMQKAGARSVGAFGSTIGPDSPYILLVSEWTDVPGWESHLPPRSDDQGLYVRKSVTLLRGFSTMPAIVAPPEGKAHVFELRTYESNNDRTLARKIRMFDEGEIALFRKVGMIPVFFGETIAGANMPNLTYMLAYEDLAARDKAWSAFVSSPEWNKMKNEPGVSDAEIVSNISNSILRPLPFSTIK